MIHKYRHGLHLLLMYIVLLGVGLVFFNVFDFNISPVRYSVLLSIMTGVTLVAYIILVIGMQKSEENRGMYLIGAIGVKFLAYLLIILLFWLNGKNLSMDFIIVFFVLYLVLTFSLVRVLFKLLNNN